MDFTPFGDFIDSYNSLSTHLRRSLNLITDLDQRYDKCVQSIDDLKDQYLQDVNHLTLEERNRRLHEISDQLRVADGFSEDKIGLTEETIQCIDKYSKSLDIEMSCLETRAKQLEERKKSVKSVDKVVIKVNQKVISVKTAKPKTQKTHKVLISINRRLKKKFETNKKPLIKRKGIESEVRSVSLDDSTYINSSETNLIVSRRSRRTKHIQNSRFNSDHYVFTPFKPRVVPKEESFTESNQIIAKVKTEALSPPKAVLESMPPNPSEPVYCICKSIAFGEMIICDNKECHIQWFHFGCVNLRDKPKGQWFCERCETKPTVISNQLSFD